MFLVPSAKNEGMILVISHFLAKALTNFVTTFGDVLHTIKLKPIFKENFSVRINHCLILLFFTFSPALSQHFSV